VLRYKINKQKWNQNKEPLPENTEFISENWKKEEKTKFERLNKSDWYGLRKEETENINSEKIN
jgi:hypothetical protein